MSKYRNIQLTTGLPFNVPAIRDITDTLPSRTPDPEQPRTPDQITHVSVHHSAVEGGTIQGYADYHVNHNGWAHIGYHVVIKDGIPFQTNDLLTFSYHTSGNNHYTVAVSISGDLSKRPLSEPERNALYAVILTYMELFNIPVENVLGHNEYPGNNTSCPCISMEQVRSDIRTLQMRMKRDDSWKKKSERITEMGGEFKYLNDLIGKGEQSGESQWAMNVYMDIYDFMKSKQYL